MTKRETRVIHAFLNCVQSGEFTEDYAITLIEDSQRYGWLSVDAKENFYAALAQRAAQAAQNTPSAANFASEDADEEEPDEEAEPAIDEEIDGEEEEEPIPDDDTPELEDALADAGDVIGAEE